MNSIEVAVLPTKRLQEILDHNESATHELIDANQRLATLENDHYVTWEWACNYLGVTLNTAKLMLADVKVLVFGKQIKRLKKSDVLRYAEEHSVPAKYVSA